MNQSDRKQFESEVVNVLGEKLNIIEQYITDNREALDRLAAGGGLATGSDTGQQLENSIKALVILRDTLRIAIGIAFFI